MTTKQKRAKSRRKQRTTKTEPPREVEGTTMIYWATPKVWRRRCEVCGHKGCEVYRHFDQSSLCGLCVEQLGIEVRESGAARRR